MAVEPQPGTFADFLAQSQANGFGSGSAFLDQQEPLVYLGRHNTTAADRSGKLMPDGQRLPDRSVKQRTSSYTDEKQPLKAAQQSIYGWDREQLNALSSKLWYMGFDLANKDDVQAAVKVWQQAVSEAADWQNGGSDLTPDDVIEMYSAANSDEMAKRIAGRNGGSITQKQNSINITDPTTARGLVQQAFHSAMGRAPTDAEVRAMTQALNAHEQKNAATTTTTQQYDSQGRATDASSVTSGGTDPGQYLSDAANADPEAAAYQGAATLFPALIQALGSPI